VKFADLHLHTSFSDGTYSPEELTGHAARCGFACVALTDHDTVEGCARMATACQAANIEFFPASELTAEYRGTELHIIGYGIDIQHPKLLSEMQRYQDVRQNRIKEMVQRLNRLNVPLQESTVTSIANCKSPGRPHVARALIQINVCKSLDEAFERFLKKGRPAWVPKFKVSADGAIALIHEAGGLAIFAHPGLVHHDSLIPDLVDAGLDGIECYHTKHPTTTVEHYLQIAEEHDLLVTGGSDCHGMNKGQPLIGTIKLPYQHVEQLKARLAADHPLRGPFSRSESI
jgi:predicted metal-dependent phosphoesterase TrpH